jgi:hypothetical protein
MVRELDQTIAFSRKPLTVDFRGFRPRAKSIGRFAI